MHGCPIWPAAVMEFVCTCTVAALLSFIPACGFFHAVCVLSTCLLVPMHARKLPCKCGGHITQLCHMCHAASNDNMDQAGAHKPHCYEHCADLHLHVFGHLATRPSISSRCSCLIRMPADMRLSLSRGDSRSCTLLVPSAGCKRCQASLMAICCITCHSFALLALQYCALVAVV